MNKKDEKQKHDDILKEIEELSKKADREKPLGLGLVDDLENVEINIENLVDTQNPQKSYSLYYSIQAMIKSNLPKGKEYEKLRKFVNEEKLIYLNQGKKIDETGKRGSDSRQAYTTLLEKAFDIVIDWVKSGANAFELYLKFKELNIELGYHDESEKEELSSFNKNLKKALDFNPREKK